jgi:hypothetical protein
MIRGVFSMVGLVIILVLLIRTLQGEMSLEDVAVRGLVIVVCIAVIDRLIVPLIGMAINATGVENEQRDDEAESSRSDVAG